MSIDSTPIYHSDDEIRDALRRLVAKAFRKPGSHLIHCFSIPANPKLDADLILYDAINELFELRQEKGNHAE